MKVPLEGTNGIVPFSRNGHALTISVTSVQDVYLYLLFLKNPDVAAVMIYIYCVNVEIKGL